MTRRPPIANEPLVLTRLRPIQERPRFPCLDASNTYSQCIGPGPCQAKGTQRCLFGKWPTATRLRAPVDEPPVSVRVREYL